MNSKHEKQTETFINEKQKKSKRHKNPYNINISFNINNPKNVISNQINKTIKVNHYSFSPQDQLTKLNKINISKILHPSSKSHSASLSKSKDLLKPQYLKDLNKYECYFDNPIHPKKHKKTKSKPYDIQTKSKSDFTYSTSILSMPFPGNDPLPEAAVKKLNRMKKYFLQKIGSMDIGGPEDTVQPSSDLISQSKHLKTSQLKVHEYEKQNNQKHEQKMPVQDDVMTEKLSEYQYENLISYENQNDQKNQNSALKSKQLFDYEKHETFPQIVLDNLNSMTIKNEYLRHHSKFLSENMDVFKKDTLNKDLKKHKIPNKVSFDQLSSEIKSKIINPFDQTYRKQDRKNQKQQKFKLLQSQQNESKTMRQKIRIIQEVLLKSDSSKSILKIGRKSEKSMMNKLETCSKVEDFYKKDVKKEYVIKTEIELPNNLVSQIKQFESQIFGGINAEKILEVENNDQKQKKASNQRELIDKMSYLQFLSSRDAEGNRKETKQLIQGYIDLLEEHLNIDNANYQRKLSNQKCLNQVPSATQIRYVSSQKSESFKIDPSQSESQNGGGQDPSDIQQDTSEVNSYIYGDKQDLESEPSIDYSSERTTKIDLQKQMREELTKRLTHQYYQKKLLNQDQTLKIILNSNLLQHSITENNSDLEYRKKTQDVSELQNLNQSRPLQTPQIKVQKNDESLSHQMDTLLGFIKQNISFNSADKQVLKDLYEKLTNISKTQSNSLYQGFIQNPKEQQQKQQNHEIISKPLQKKYVETPKKSSKFFKKPASHKRMYSIQKDTTKISRNMMESDDINLWDLILVQESLSRKYNQITYEKEKQLFQIQTDPALTYEEYQQKIDELQRWQNSSKRQILQTKKEIKAGIQNLRKILTPQSTQIFYKMKCFSEKLLIPRFNQTECGIHTVQNQSPISKSLFNSQKEIEQVNKNKNAYEGSGKFPQNKKLHVNNQKRGKVPKVEVNLDSIFIEQSDHSDLNSENSNYNKTKETLYLQKDIESKSSIQKHQIYSPQKNQKQSDPCSVPRVQLFRTGSSRYKDFLQNHENESIGSQKSSKSSQNYNNQNVYQQNPDERQDFIDLLKIQKYKLGNLDQLSDEFESQTMEDTIQKLPETFSQTTIEPNSLLISNFKITQEDKLDICEFILLDLCIEMYQETLDLEDSEIKKGAQQNSSIHRIMNQVFAFIKKEKKKPKKKCPKIGIHTELQTVKDYVQKIKQYIQSLEKKSPSKSHQNSEHGLIISRINSSIGPTATEILKTMRFYEDDVFESKEQNISLQFSHNEDLNSLILPVHVFTDFEEKLQGDKEFVFDTYFDDPEKQKNRLAFLKNVTHVHHKALFDALNQMLDFERPWSIWGKPFPWKTKNGKQKSCNREDLQVSFKNSCEKVIECAMYMCGLLIDKEQSLVKNTSVSETYIEEVKEDRMSKMIINDFIQNQNRFYFLDDEETQILLETSYVVWILLIQEATREINEIKKQDKRKLSK